MDNSTHLEQRFAVLRHELKHWEKQFAEEHTGRKAGREDIKADATISKKYKEYNKIRDILSSKTTPQTPSKPSRKRKITEYVERTPKGRLPTSCVTPMKRFPEEGQTITNISGSGSKSISPQGPLVIGPTPQRDGIVLGLFDLLPAETPSRTDRTVLGNVVPNGMQTPSKPQRTLEGEGSIETRVWREKTPLSAGKRFLLDKFATPQKRKRDDETTPSSTFNHLSTPAFLRRDNVLDIINEEAEETPRPAPWRRRGIGRSLSSMIQAMKKKDEEVRKLEEEELEEDLAMMREMEMEVEGFPVPKKPRIVDAAVEDSQAPMPLGPDGAAESDEDEEIGANGNPRRVWKKRGQKRQTRRAILRPTFLKTKPQLGNEVSEEEKEEPNCAAEIQIYPDVAGSGDEFSEEDDASDYSNSSHTPKRRKVEHKKPDIVPKAQPENKEGGGVVKAAVRRVKESAHANYRRLKIKAKAGNGGNVFEGCRPTSTWSPQEDIMTKHVPCAPVNATASVEIRLASELQQPPASTTPINLPTTEPPLDNPTLNYKPASSLQSLSVSPINMAENELRDLLKQLHQTLQSHQYQQSASLLSRAKVALLNLNALIPSEESPRLHVQLARETLELGALISIRLRDPTAFTRYFQQLQPFYSLPEEVLPKEGSNASKITGLYLLLLLSDGDYAGFHTSLETLEVAAAQAGGKGLEEDVFIQYPIRLERALMEGSYDRVWGETKSERVPSEEFGMFSEVLIGTIRKEIASCSEKAYPSVPISDAKSLLFLDSEGAVVKFAQECGWVVKDGRIYFPQQEETLDSDIMATSDQVIENTLGYARQLETIV
ncbi:hypothetical protein GQ43DRAFT_390847 [Delitschia confertaspora ATCC 74209]|uniref:DNA replication regulator SLD2 n=1 Tax=Delitschia confertaspora ATCC 74209 TaxID=1513339 RepID=A0A9P4JRH8_9PLEO|nr:hypothetical protein GQ43DRAFT_390847 [Delitschia confertaspora ATCC 74209]